MLFHNEPLFSIYWGDKKEGFLAGSIKGVFDSSDFEQSSFVTLACRLMDLKSLVILNQKHTAQGYVITRYKELQTDYSELTEGDYLITTLTQVGLGVASGDCLPLIAYDPCKNVIGIAHVGWRGALQEIALRMVESMQARFGTRLDDIRIFLGPSAKVCCYGVKEDMVAQLGQFAYAQQTVFERHGEFFFDLPLFNILQLESYGLPRSAFHNHYNMCTICNPSFCSYRRDGGQSLRQMTIAALK